ncbi:MAG: hypothetical protein ACLT64_09585 [Streptococcus salivarius]
MEKETIIFQRNEFDDYYRSVLNGGKYVDPDCREDIDTPYYNFLTEFLRKERVKVIIKINILLFP